VVFQVAVSAVLLVGTSLFLQMITVARAQRAGFAVDGVAMLETDARYAGYSGARATNVYDELRRKVAASPGVQSTTLTRGQPMEVTGLPLVVEGAAVVEPAPVVGAIWAGPGFFETLQIPILFGRAIDERDREGAPRAAVISEKMARQHFGGVNAVGRRFGSVRPGTGRGGRRGARHGTADLGRFDRSHAAPGLRVARAVGPASNTVIARTSLDAPVWSGRCSGELRADTALPVLAARRCDSSSRIADRPEAVAGVPGRLGAVACRWQESALRRDRVRCLAAIARDRHPHALGAKPAGRLERGARRRRVDWRGHRRGDGALRAPDTGHARV
jgi:hypothetical protein